NLQRSSGEDKPIKENLNRNERIKKEEYKIYQAQRNQPYNRQFNTPQTDISVVGRVERKKYKKQAKMQAGFISWVMGVFSALIIILLASSVLKGTGSDVSAKWSGESKPMITETIADDSTENSDEFVTDNDDVDDETESITDNESDK